MTKILLFLFCGMLPNLLWADSFLERVFTKDILGENIDYFEDIAGEPVTQANNTRFYTINNCEVMTLVKNELVVAVRLKLNEQCSFDLNKFVKASKGAFPAANKMTFWDLNTLTSVERGFTADCLIDCDDQDAPLVTEFFSGSKANGGICFIPQVIAQGAAAKAVKVWRDVMLKNEGKAWIKLGQFKNGKRSYVPDAINALKEVKPTYLMVGLGEDDPRR